MSAFGSCQKVFVVNTYTNPKMFHGGNVEISKLEPCWMAHADANQQEGVGIYFTNNFSCAASYGPYVVEAEIDLADYIESRSLVRESLSLRTVIDILSLMNDEIWETDDFYYFVSDYIEVCDKRKLTPKEVRTLASKFMDTEVRLFQNEIADINTEVFVSAWSKFVDKKGTFHWQTDEIVFVAIIDPNVLVSKVRR